MHRWRKVSPHPLWLPLILICLRHGTFIGIITGFFCSGAVIYGQYYGGEDIVASFHLHPERLFEPIIMPIVALLIARSVQILNDKVHDFRRALDEQREVCHQLEGERARLEHAYHRLEGAFAGQRASVGAFYTMAQHILVADQEAMWEAVHACVHRYLGATVVAIWYPRDAGNWQRGMADAEASTTVPALVERVRRQRQIVHAAEINSQDDETGAILAARYWARTVYWSALWLLKLCHLPFLMIDLFVKLK